MPLVQYSTQKHPYNGDFHPAIIASLTHLNRKLVRKHANLLLWIDLGRQDLWLQEPQAAGSPFGT